MRHAIIIAMLAIALPASAQLSDVPASPRLRARHDVLITWSPRFRLDTTTGPLGLEDQIWRRVDALPMHHRVSLDATGLEGRLDVHLAGWGALDLFADSGGGIAAGDLAIGYLELAVEPVRLWAGRRFVTFGPPGGLHVDGGGASVRSSIGIVAEAFAGRPVTSIRASLIGSEPSFDGATIAYGARVGYVDAGRLGASAGYAELWGHGILGSRTVDLSAYWYPGDVRFEAATKIDARDPGLLSAHLAASYHIVPELGIDADYLHVEPGRWIPPWSILSVFETSTFDEISAGAVIRPVRALAIRAEAAGRLYSSVGQGEPRLGYRAELSARVVPTSDPGARLRVHVSRRDDGVLGYTVVQGGVAFDPADILVVTLDGALAIDDRGGRESLIGRASLDVDVAPTWSIGGTFSVARTPIVPAEARALLRASWTPRTP